MESSDNNLLFKIAGIGALIAFIANVLDVALGFGSSEVMSYGTKSAVEWFTVFQQNWFKGIYSLGVFNIIYMIAMTPVYLGMVVAHLKKGVLFAILATMIFMVAMPSYISGNAAIPMYVLSNKYTSATNDTQKNLYISSGEAILSRGEDFTPGSFIGLFLSGIAAILISIVMLRGKIFGKANAWIGIVGFTFLSLFTLIATFIPSLYLFAFYVFGSLGGIFALLWFILVAIKFFKLKE